VSDEHLTFSAALLFDLANAHVRVYQNVRPSVTRRYSIAMAKHILKLFLSSNSHTILVFPYQTVWQYLDGDPLTGASNARGIKMRFSTNVSLYL